jgi:hypothetical protein
MEELLRAIAKVIGTKFNYPIHLKDEKIVRPCFQIYVAAGNESDYNKFAVKDNLIIQVVFFAPKIKNELGEVLDQVAQNEVMFQLKKAFAKKMYFVLSDGKVFINGRSTGYTEDKDIFLQLNLERWLNRELDESETDFDLIQEVNLKMIEVKNMEEVDVTWH